MIPKDTIDDIFLSSKIEEVVGDFIPLKQRGVNMLGVCPFHDEKTPSFTVSPAKGIYKCFGCGAGGNSINFIMEHEHFTYPEALRYLANKYNIHIEEEELSPEMEEAQSERESMYVVAAFAEKHFIEQLHETNTGKAIGLSYFKERGFTEETIETFKLGYAQDEFGVFYDAAKAKGYKSEFLVSSGLVKDKNGKHYDGYRGRVIFPIHNLSGRPIGFGGRTLKTDKKIPKYINSPENAIYNKSKVLYGLFHSKKEIIKQDNCFLVEGYTDVISMHQAGVKNVVASSGTSLTTDQIKLINRFSKNITILYDGDVAGIKASFRGIDMILKEGMNVKVVLFPEGEDPDSFSKNSAPGELNSFITDNSKDFIVFKTDLLFEETQGDPIKKAKLIHEIIDSIALIPDEITRSVYIKECSRVLDVAEKTLISELNRSIRKALGKQETSRSIRPNEAPVVDFQQTEKPPVTDVQSSLSFLEKHILRALLLYGEESMTVKVENESQNVLVSVFLLNMLFRDDVSFEVPLLQKVLTEYLASLEEGTILSQNHFLNHSDPEIGKLTIDLISTKYELDNWVSKHIYVETEKEKLYKLSKGVLYSYLCKKVELKWNHLLEQLKTASPNDLQKTQNLLRQQIALNKQKKAFSLELGRTILPKI